MSTEVESGNNQTTAAPVTEAAAQPAVAQAQAPAQPATEAAKPAEVAKPAEQPKPAAVEYQPFKVPENVKVAEVVLGKFSEIAKASNLPQEAAQKMLDELAPLIAKDSTEAFHAQLAEARKGWQESVKVDKELGGEKTSENLAIAKQTFDKFGTPALKELLETSGLGDHPEIVRWAHKVAKAVGEDKVIPGGLSAGASQKDPASVLYDAPKAA